MYKNIEDILELMSRATGDEKHDESAFSTLHVLWVLYDRIMHYDAAHPDSESRDRFVLSKGHGPLAYYAILAAKGFFAPEVLATFNAWGSILGSHPDRNKIPGVETSTGSLGHGLPMAIGMALGLRLKRSTQHVYVLIGDGECNEGTIWESALLAGNRHLTNLTAILIDNQSSSQSLGDIAAKFTAFGWHTLRIYGSSEEQIYTALIQRNAERPTMIVARTVTRGGV